MTAAPLASNGLPSPWTDQRVTLLRKLWAEGYVAHFIAVQLGGGLTKNAVIGKALRIGLEKRRTGAPVSPESERAHVPRPVRPQIDRVWRPFLGIALLDLEREHCRYPKDKGQGRAEFVFCGQPIQAGSSYCGHHHGICYGRSIPSAPRKFAPTWRAA